MAGYKFLVDKSLPPCLRTSANPMTAIASASVLHKLNAIEITKIMLLRQLFNNLHSQLKSPENEVQKCYD